MSAGRARAVAALAVGLAGPVAGFIPARAEIRPSLDDFYERTRTRTEHLEACEATEIGLCGADYALVLLAGGQVANPSTDAARPALAEGPRLGVDGTWAWNGVERKNLVRGRAWLDWLHVNETGEGVTDFATEALTFLSLYPDEDAGVEGSLDAVLAQREELAVDDFAQFQVRPYRVLDVEAEVAPYGVEVDKDGKLAVPLGYARRVRWGLAGDTAPDETRDTFSGAVAIRGYQSGRHTHAQLDLLRVTRTLWDTPAGEADGWALTAGYQHLSPGIDELHIWILGGYGWYGADGADGGAAGFLAQTGATVDLADEPGARQIRGGYDAHFVLDRDRRHFERVMQWRLGYQDAWRILAFGLDYEGVALDSVATLHAFTPLLAVRPLGPGRLTLGLRYRLAFAHDERHPGAAGTPDQDRFSATADWLF